MVRERLSLVRDACAAGRQRRLGVCDGEGGTCRQRPVSTMRYLALASRICRPPVRSSQGLGWGTRGKAPTVASPSHRKTSHRLPEAGGGVLGIERLQLSRKTAESKEESLCMCPSSDPSCTGFSLPSLQSSVYMDSSFSPISRAHERYSLSSTLSPPKSSPWKRRTEMPDASTVRDGWFGSSGLRFLFSPSE